MKQSAEKSTLTSNDKRVSIPKVATNIHGLDEILEGGFPEGQITVISGGPGSGKTVLGLEFAYRSALSGNPCIFVSFEERAPALRRNAMTMGWHLENLEKSNQLSFIDSRPGPNTLRAGDFDLKGFLAILEGHARFIGAARIVIDALDVFLRIFTDSIKQRDQLCMMLEWLSDKGYTSVLTARQVSENEDFSRHQFLEYATDCLIQMDLRVLGQIATRRLRVVKYRGSAYGSNEYPCIIGPGGIFLMPISTIGLMHSGLGETISCGNPALDEVLGGGYRKCSSILVSGSAGTGKTSMLCSFAASACSHGQKILFVNFEESIEAMFSGMLSIGIDLRPYIDDGTLQMITAMPESMGSEEHLYRLFTAMERFRPDHVVVDAISATLRIGSPQASFQYIMRLITACKDRGITTLLSNQVGSKEVGDISGLGVSSLVDTLILMRYANNGTEIKRVFLAIKSRGMPHSSKHYEFQITDRGIALIAPYVFTNQNSISQHHGGY